MLEHIEAVPDGLRTAAAKLVGEYVKQVRGQHLELRKVQFRVDCPTQRVPCAAHSGVPGCVQRDVQQGADGQVGQRPSVHPTHQLNVRLSRGRPGC